ncbi:NAD-dependent epimerase/dehydratase family protein [Rubrivirga sp. IMCC43871]|uniref:NAD-dependent epimerase/dehydratase family protein n=1 Tax=Rubrivirga sp. IMCC43871 TaxID=3391575 RepID=UPI00398FCB39
MTALVTGATGQIGRVLVDRLVEEGMHVRAIVRPSSDTAHLAGLGVETVVCRLDDPGALAEAARGCDVVYHLAVARGRPPETATTSRRVNIDATEALAQAASSAGVGRFVFASTVGVYGLTRGGVVDESRPLRPNSPYRQSKAEGEAALRRVEAETGLPVVIARISKTVGPTAVRTAGLYQVIAGRAFRLVGGGANRITPAHTRDIADGLVRCANTPAAAGETYVLAGSDAITWRSYVDLIAASVGVPPPPAGVPATLHRAYLRADALLFRATGHTLPRAHEREMFVMDRVCSIDKARRELGYAPAQPMEVAVQQMAEAFRARGLIDA